VQNGHEGRSDEGDHSNARDADQRLHVQVFVGQRDIRVIIRVTEPTSHAAEFSIPPSSTGKLLGYTGLPWVWKPGGIRERLGISRRFDEKLGKGTYWSWKIALDELQYLNQTRVLLLTVVKTCNVVIGAIW